MITSRKTQILRLYSVLILLKAVSRTLKLIVPDLFYFLHPKITSVFLIHAHLLALAVKACTLCLRTAACIAACNANFFRLAFAVLVETAILGMAAHTGFLSCAAHRICHTVSSLTETVAACLIGLGSVLPSYHNVALSAKLIFVIHTIFYRTF